MILAFSVVTVLAECGLTPGDVTEVFLTHAHFDHMGNIEDFPNATFYIQERELSKWVWAMSLERRFRWLRLAVLSQKCAIALRPAFRPAGLCSAISL